MVIKIFIAIGIYLLSFSAGGAFGNWLLHLGWCFSIDRIPQRYKSTFMGTHLGNATAAIVSLFIGALILTLLNYKFGFNLNTLFLFLGISLMTITIARRFDRRDTREQN